MDERLTAKFIVTNSDGKETVSVSLGEMKLKDILILETALLEVMKKDAEARFKTL